MKNAIEVLSDEWSGGKVLFDDNDYSVVSGMYRGKPHLGERWNADCWNSDPASPDEGFPRDVKSGRAVFHIVPAFLEIPLLHALLDELGRNLKAQLDPHRADLFKSVWQELQQRLRPR